MAREILVVNPKKKKKRAKRKTTKRTTKKKSTAKRVVKKRTTGAETMKKTKKRKTTRKKTTARKNPRPRRKANPKRRVRRALVRGFGGLDIKGTLQKTPWAIAGMLASKWAAKRFDPDASETDPASWDYKSYIKGALGAFAAAALANSIKPGKGKIVLEGGLYLMMYKAVQNELIANSPWAVEQFGADPSYVPTEYLLTGDDDQPYGYDEMGQMYPVDDRHRLPEVTEMGSALEPVGPLGGALEPVGPLGFGADPFAEAYF